MSSVVISQRKKPKKRSQQFYLFLLLLAILLVLLIVAPDFYSLNNVMSSLNRLSYVMIGSLGMTLIILTSNIDVSSGALVSVICLLTALVGKLNVPFIGLLVFAIIIGVILSLINSIFVTKIKIPAMVATLATAQLFAGILPLTVEGSVYDLPPSFTWLGFDAKLFGFIPLSILIMLIIVVAMLLFMKFSKFSKKIYAVGNNEQAARYAGINTKKTVMLVYIVAGALFGISAVIIATASQRVTTTMGTGLEMSFIAATVLGGTSINGGSGSLSGTVLGATILTIIAPAINYLGISSDWSDAIMGGIIIVSVIFSELRIQNEKN